MRGEIELVLSVGVQILRQLDVGRRICARPLHTFHNQQVKAAQQQKKDRGQRRPRPRACNAGEDRSGLRSPRTPDSKVRPHSSWIPRKERDIRAPRRRRRAERPSAAPRLAGTFWPRIQKRRATWPALPFSEGFCESFSASGATGQARSGPAPSAPSSRARGFRAECRPYPGERRS